MAHQVLVSFLSRRQLGCSKEREAVLKDACGLYSLRHRWVRGSQDRSSCSDSFLGAPGWRWAALLPQSYPPLWSGLNPRSLLPLCHSVTLSTCTQIHPGRETLDCRALPWLPAPFNLCPMSSACPQAAEAGQVCTQLGRK